MRKISRLSKEEIEKVYECIDIFYTGNNTAQEVCNKHGVLLSAFNYYKKKRELEINNIKKIQFLSVKKKVEKIERMSKKDKENWDGMDEQLKQSGLKPIKTNNNGVDYLAELNKIYGI